MLCGGVWRRFLARRQFLAAIGDFRRRYRAAIRIEALARGRVTRARLQQRLELERRVFERQTAAQLLQSLRMRMVGHHLLLQSLYGGFGFRSR